MMASYLLPTFIRPIWRNRSSIPSIPPKERLEVADILIVVFDEFGKVDDDLMDEDLDKELRAAVRSHIGDPLDEPDEDYDDE